MLSWRRERGTIAKASAVIVALGASVGSACSQTVPIPGERPPSPLAGTLTASGVLASAQEAVDRAGSFEIAVQGHNFVLPQWGGVDGGLVSVAGGGQALATLVRTGDGLYTMYLVNRQTYFERSTCSHWLRVPGGGSTVLSPFLWSTTSPLSSASQASIVSETTAVAVVSATITALGAGTATIWIARATNLPVKMTWTASASAGNGGTTSWSFSGWGVPVLVSEQLGSPSDNGPGGNPC
jgi:hypothetical protein